MALSEIGRVVPYGYMTEKKNRTLFNQVTIK